MASLAPLNRALTEALQGDLRGANPFARDAVMAVQRDWLLGLPAACHLPDDASAPPGAAPVQCLSQQFRSQTAILAAWHAPQAQAIGNAAMAQYVQFRFSAGVQGLNGPVCGAAGAGC